MEISNDLASSQAALYRPSAPIANAKRYQGLCHQSYMLPRGHQQYPGSMRLACDIQVDHDVPVELRDGIIILVDIYRPVGSHRYPAIMGWGPYGKRGGWLTTDFFGHPTRMDVPVAWEDGLNCFEGPNPSYWVNHGYVVITPNPRGVFNSNGDIRAWGTAEGRDEYDLIEWIAAQDWCNGRVGLTGNSWLAMSQWFAAAENPPHLSAIAPWEGAHDIYRENMARGGIPDLVFAEGIFSGLNGNNRTEDPVSMLKHNPLFSAYWADKVAAIEKIKVPAYVVASWTNLLHTQGSLAGWRRLNTNDKWLRIHNAHEWKDYYHPENVDDLRRFFDHFLKCLNNGWNATPRVRLSVLDPGGIDTVNRPETTFPLERQAMTSFYLGHDGQSGYLSPTPVTKTGQCTYEHNDARGAKFLIPFDQDVELTGHIQLKLWVQSLDHDDMDVFAIIRKIDRAGRYIESTVVTGLTHPGPNGRLRVSLRSTCTDKSNEDEPSFTFDHPQKISPEMIVPINIEFWPYAMRWRSGETLELWIGGIDLLKRPEFPTLPPIQTLNVGRHVIHMGGNYDSKIVVPVIPY